MGVPVRYRMFGSIFVVLYTPEAVSIPAPVMARDNISRHCQITLGCESLLHSVYEHTLTIQTPLRRMGTLRTKCFCSQGRWQHERLIENRRSTEGR